MAQKLKIMVKTILISSVCLVKQMKILLKQVIIILKQVILLLKLVTISSKVGNNFGEVGDTFNKGGEFFVKVGEAFVSNPIFFVFVQKTRHDIVRDIILYFKKSNYKIRKVTIRPWNCLIELQPQKFVACHFVGLTRF